MTVDGAECVKMLPEWQLSTCQYAYAAYYLDSRCHLLGCSCLPQLAPDK